MVEAQKVLKGYVSVTWDPYSLKKVDLSHPKYYDGSNGNFYVLDVPEKGKYLTIRHTGASASLTENFPSKNFPSSYKYLKNGTQIGVTKLFAILKKFDVRSIEAENYGRDVELPNEYIDWSHFSGTVMKNDYGASHSFLHTFTFKDGKFVKVKLEIDASPMGYYK